MKDVNMLSVELDPLSLELNVFTKEALVIFSSVLD